MNITSDLFLCLQSPEVNLDKVKSLLDSGAHMNYDKDHKENYMVLHYIASNSKVDHKIVEFLLKKGANPNAINILHGNQTALVHAVRKPKIDLKVIEVLLQNGAMVNTSDFRSGLTALQYALDEPIIDFALVDLLIKSGANISAMNSGLAVFYVIGKPNVSPALIEVLLRYGPDIHLRGMFTSCNILHFAACNPNCGLEVIELLLRYEVDVHDRMHTKINHDACMSVLKHTVLKQAKRDLSHIDGSNNSKSMLGATFFNLVSQYVSTNVIDSYVKDCAFEIGRLMTDGLSALLFPPCNAVDKLSFGETRVVARRLLDVWFERRCPIYMDVIGTTVASKDVFNLLGMFRIYTRTGETERAIFLNHDSTLQVVKFLPFEDMLSLVDAIYGPFESSAATVKRGKRVRKKKKKKKRN